jgi:hypothetical protein
MTVIGGIKAYVTPLLQLLVHFELGDPFIVPELCVAYIFRGHRQLHKYNHAEYFK